jgi:hypothetical protein
MVQRTAYFLLATIILASCASVSSNPLPPRTFPTADLLIQCSQLPDFWQLIAEEDQEFSCHSFDYDYYHCLEVQSRRLRFVYVDFRQYLARFDNVDVAALTYRRHDYTRSTTGTYGTTYHPLDGFTYKSSVADQFQVLCWSFNDKSLLLNDIVGCTIEAQYEEFLSTVLYSSLNMEQAPNDIEAIAKAIDTQMATFLGSK